MPVKLRDPNIIIYGGSFDPPHEGHLHCIKSALNRFPVSKIYIMLSHSPAGASGEHKAVKTPFSHRWQMLERLVLELPEVDRGRVELRDDEKNMAAPNYTVKTLRALKKSCGDDHLALLVGKDQLESFSRWFEASEICQMADLVCVNREALSDLNLQELAKSQISNGLGLELIQSKDDVLLFDGDFKVYTLEVERVDAASSDIRARDIQSHPGLTESLKKYIQDHNLYSEV